MAATMKPGWSKPSTILFASEIPANEKAFGFALAQAKEFGANLILFHAYDTMVVAASETSGIRYYDYAAAARAEIASSGALGPASPGSGRSVRRWWCGPDWPPTRFSLSFASARSTASSWARILPAPSASCWWARWLKRSCAPPGCPVFIVGPDVVDGRYRNYATSTILCAVSLHETSYVVAAFAAELAVQHNARLVLQHVIRPQERAEVLAGRTIDEIESDLLSLVPAKAAAARSPCRPSWCRATRPKNCSTRRRAQQADLIVLGAQGASAFAAIARHGVVYKVLAHSHCPVITLSPVVLAECGVKFDKEHRAEVFLAGVF